MKSFPLRSCAVLCLSFLLLSACRKQAPDSVFEARKSRGELFTTLASAPLTLDPRGLANPDTACLQQLIFNTLLKKGPNYDLVPDLAESWDMTPDARKLTVRMRPNVVFHDGRPCTARDVAFTFNSLIEHHMGKASAFAKLEKVIVADVLVAEFSCREPNPGLPVDLPAVGIIPEGGSADFEKKPVGTGPYEVLEYLPDRHILLRSFGRYFARPEPPGTQATQLTVRFIPDTATRELELKNGGLDFLLDGGVEPDSLKAWASLPGWTVKTFPGGGILYLALNTERKPLDDVRVRKALALAVNRDEIVKRILGGTARVADGPLPPGHWARSDRLPKPEFNPQAAKTLLAEVGFDPARTFRLLISSDPTQRRMAQILQEMWREVGARVVVEPAEPQLYHDRMRYGDFDIVVGRMAGGNQFTTIFKGAFHSRAIHVRGVRGEGELNYARYRDPALDAMIDRAQALPFSTDPGTEREKYLEIQERVASERVWIPLWHPDHVLIARSDIDGFEFPPGGGGEVFALARRR